MWRPACRLRESVGGIMRLLSAYAGYTPLHMAVGYSHVGAVAALLDAGANPEVQDRQSRDVIALVESIREKMPISPEWMGKRMALEQVISLLGSEFIRLPPLAQRVSPWAILCLTFLTAVSRLAGVQDALPPSCISLDLEVGTRHSFQPYKLACQAVRPGRD